MGGWVGGWVGGKVVCFSGFRTRCWSLWCGWVGGWIGARKQGDVAELHEDFNVFLRDFESG